jgi:hypothetical protein
VEHIREGREKTERRRLGREGTECRDREDDLGGTESRTGWEREADTEEFRLIE